MYRYHTAYSRFVETDRQLIAQPMKELYAVSLQIARHRSGAPQRS